MRFVRKYNTIKLIKKRLIKYFEEMKKTFLIASLLSIAFYSCNKKETATETPVATEAVVEKPESDFDRLENKVVMAETGEWYVIKEGQRWIALSEQATTDFLKSVENGEDNVVKNVPVKTLDQFPLVGEILPNLEYKKIEPKTAQ